MFQNDIPIPSGHDFLQRQTKILCQSYQHWTGVPLIEFIDVENLWQAPFAVVSHGNESDPIFNYGNALALEVFDYSWHDFIRLPSKHSAEVINQAEREALLAQVSQYGFIANYAGVRIASNGARFLIQNATVWNLLDETGNYCGQAAKIVDWQPF